ncbi:hypothetical protein Moror_17250 [Moniliophthora roreri MCA 2997]|uniref:Uncharacterized protein n=2 Tax=Moniliophthora roreri TaxID=221103 RepID=V2XY91_MONRO|nr:hypothetical protein Moror_17250 [Moniliophthora roreri MCA 2997]
MTNVGLNGMSNVLHMWTGTEMTTGAFWRTWIVNHGIILPEETNDCLEQDDLYADFPKAFPSTVSMGAEIDPAVSTTFELPTRGVASLFARRCNRKAASHDGRWIVRLSDYQACPFGVLSSRKTVENDYQGWRKREPTIEIKADKQCDKLQSLKTPMSYLEFYILLYRIKNKIMADLQELSPE